MDRLSFTAPGVGFVHPWGRPPRDRETHGNTWSSLENWSLLSALHPLSNGCWHHTALWNTVCTTFFRIKVPPIDLCRKVLARLTRWKIPFCFETVRHARLTRVPRRLKKFWFAFTVEPKTPDSLNPTPRKKRQQRTLYLRDSLAYLNWTVSYLRNRRIVPHVETENLLVTSFPFFGNRLPLFGFRGGTLQIGSQKGNGLWTDEVIDLLMSSTCSTCATEKPRKFPMGSLSFVWPSVEWTHEPLHSPSRSSRKEATSPDVAC